MIALLPPLHRPPRLVMALKVCVVAALVAVAASRFAPSPSPSPYSSPSQGHGVKDPANYEFHFGVNDDYTGNDFSQQESRDGQETRGSYQVLLPDGRLQKVTYYVRGDSGFVAKVTYEYPNGTAA